MENYTSARFHAFASDESGAVTVDWVVLTAGIIGLGVAVMTSVGSGVMDLSKDIQVNLGKTEIASYESAPQDLGSLKDAFYDAFKEANELYGVYKEANGQYDKEPSKKNKIALDKATVALKESEAKRELAEAAFVDAGGEKGISDGWG